MEESGEIGEVPIVRSEFLKGGNEAGGRGPDSSFVTGEDRCNERGHDCLP
jgi:hypothetical protein